MIIAVAGRRIDAPGTSPERFPVGNVAAVRERMRSAFRDSGVTGLVCAAACGVDLIALELAGEMGLRRRIVLPFEKEAFKRISVTDRGAEWGEMFDRILAEAEASGDVISYDYEPGDGDIFFAVNHDILDTAEELAESSKQELGALVVWDQTPRGEDDVTAHFFEEAKQRGLKVGEISTLV